MKKTGPLQKVPQLILAFICSLLLFGLVALGCLKVTLFNEGFMIRQSHSAEYAKYMTKEVNETIQDYGRGSNIPPKALGNPASEKLIQDNIDSYIRGVYTEVPFTLIGKEQVTSQIQGAVDRYAKEKGYTIDANVQQGVNKLKDTGTDVLQQYVELPYLLTYGQKVRQFDKTLTVLLGVLGAVFLLAFLGTMLLAGRWWHRKLRMAAYIFGGSGLMLVVLPAVIYLSGTVERVAITSQAMYRFVTSYLNGFLLTYIGAGIIGLLLGFALWLGSEVLRKRLVRTGA